MSSQVQYTYALLYSTRKNVVGHMEYLDSFIGGPVTRGPDHENVRRPSPFVVWLELWGLTDHAG